MTIERFLGPREPYVSEDGQIHPQGTVIRVLIGYNLELKVGDSVETDKNGFITLAPGSTSKHEAIGKVISIERQFSAGFGPLTTVDIAIMSKGLEYELISGNRKDFSISGDKKEEPFNRFKTIVEEL